MGHYTGVRGTIRFVDSVQEKVAEYLGKLNAALDAGKEDWKELGGFWEYAHNNLREDAPERAEIAKWLKFFRCNFIPQGRLQNSSWDDFRTKILQNEMHFICSLKNYEGEIEYFTEKLLPKIALNWFIDVQEESSDVVTRHWKGNVLEFVDVQMEVR